jgi:hypothetical protein
MIDKLCDKCVGNYQYCNNCKHNPYNENHLGIYIDNYRQIYAGYLSVNEGTND